MRGGRACWWLCAALLVASPAVRASEPAPLLAVVQAAPPPVDKAAGKVVDKAAAAALARFRGANDLLAQQLDGSAGLDAGLKAAQLELVALDQKLAALRAERSKVEARVAVAGATESVGLLLWRERAGLPSDESLQEGLRRRRDQLGELQLRLLDYDEQALTADDAEARAAEQLELLPSSVSAAQRAPFDDALRLLLAERVRLLTELRDLGRRYLEVLLDVEARQSSVAEETAAFRNFITTHVMWLRSATPLDGVSPRKVLTDSWDALRWLVHPRNWSGLLAALVADARHRPLVASCCLALIALLVRLRWPMRRRLESVATLVSRSATDSFALTLEALACTLVLALAWPVVWWLFSWRLSVCATGGDFEQSIGAALRHLVTPAFGLAFVHKLCRPRGLGEAHFHWAPGVTRSLRWTVRLLTLIWLPAMFVTAVLSHHRNDAWEESLGRLTFVLAAIATTLICRRVLRPTGSIMQAVGAIRRDSWSWRLRHVWRGLIMLLPLVCALLALSGYFYTGLVLQSRLQATLWLTVTLSVAYALLLRWMTVARRQLALATARAARRAEALAAAAGESADAPPPVSEDEDAPLDLELVDAQTRKLLRAVLALALMLGTWRIWADVLPAFDALNGVTLWEHAAAGAQPMPMLDAGGRALLDASGKPQLGMAPVKQAVTLVNLLAALLAAAMGVIAARNVPSLLELAVLRRLPIGAAGRYAAKTLARYVLIVLSIVAVFGALGVAWGDVQWLAAAVTVGLGFGLQEIFANFMAGIILLLERPIRVGDTVTVGGVTGDVARIRMRATTITDWDRRELLVPNKEFITGQVVNWTLSDSVLRVVISVGVAYGSDTAMVCKLLWQIAKDEDLVLDDPPTSVLFTAFGDSSLNFELRVFVASPTAFRAVRHSINLAIDAAFREAGIEIAFPQRDIHIRSIPPEWRGAARGDVPEASPGGAPA